MGFSDSESDIYYSGDDPGEPVRRIRRIKRVSSGSRDDLLLVEVDPPFPGGSDTGHRDELRYVLLAVRWEGRSLFPIDGWPQPVNVLLPLLSNVDSREEYRDDELLFAMVGTLFPNEDWARDPYNYVKSRPGLKTTNIGQIRPLKS